MSAQTKRASRHQRARAFDLHRREVHAGHGAALHQFARDRHAVAAAEVEHARAVGQQGREAGRASRRSPSPRGRRCRHGRRTTPGRSPRAPARAGRGCGPSDAPGHPREAWVQLAPSFSALSAVLDPRRLCRVGQEYHRRSNGTSSHSVSHGCRSWRVEPVDRRPTPTARRRQDSVDVTLDACDRVAILTHRERCHACIRQRRCEHEGPDRPRPSRAALVRRRAARRRGRGADAPRARGARLGSPRPGLPRRLRTPRLPRSRRPSVPQAAARADARQRAGDVRYGRADRDREAPLGGHGPLDLPALVVLGARHPQGLGGPRLRDGRHLRRRPGLCDRRAQGPPRDARVHHRRAGRVVRAGRVQRRPERAPLPHPSRHACGSPGWRCCRRSWSTARPA